VAPAEIAEPQAHVAETPTAWVLRAVRFAGNGTTQARTLLRELPFREGDTVTAIQLEAGRQAIQNLNLFKEVSLHHKADGNGGVEATYTVREKWYVLGYPRVDANADGEYAYGVQMDWNNLWGLNHVLRVSALRKNTEREGIGIEQNLTLGYSAPQVFDTRWSMGLGSSYTERPVDNDLGQYQERLQAYQAVALRTFEGSQPSQGWSLGAGLLWTHQQTSNGIAEYGEALGPVGLLGYRDIKLNIFSEEGTMFGSRLDAAVEGAAADYDFARLTVNAIRYLRVGEMPHQTVHFFGNAGFNWAGPNSVRNFTLGGVGALRGYSRGFREGNAYYHFGAEWLRPVYRPWLRTLVIAEAGNVFAQPNDIEPTHVRASIGLGLRIRITTFVNVQLEAGVAYPLEGGAPRFFAGQLSP